MEIKNNISEIVVKYRKILYFDVSICGVNDNEYN